MCPITLNWQPTSHRPLVIAANRDEFYVRPALGLHHWSGQPILAGQDLQAGGTWLGLGICSASGRMRLAALTNYRDIENQRMNAESRGHITASFLNSSLGAKDFLETLASNVSRYNPFNLILSVSNADFNTPWPKLERLRTSFEQALSTTDDDDWLQDRLFELLSDDNIAPDTVLPKTGIALERERLLSAAFIHTPDYGTRASSVIVVRQQSTAFIERGFDADGLKDVTVEKISGGRLCLA